ncbi:hypothetical protein FF1_009947 [Malus domestica]
MKSDLTMAGPSRPLDQTPISPLPSSEHLRCRNVVGLLARMEISPRAKHVPRRGGEKLLKGKLVPPMGLRVKQQEMQNAAFSHSSIQPRWKKKLASTHGSHTLIPTWTCKLRTSNSSDGCTHRNHHSQPSSPSVFQKKPNGCEGPRRCCAALPSSQRRYQLRALIRLTADLWDTVCTEVLTDLDFPDPDVNVILKSRSLPFFTSHSSSYVELKSLIDDKS